MMELIDVVILGYGLYTIYGALKMKKTRELSRWLIGDQPAAGIRDAQGYIDYIYGRIIVMGVMAVVFGAIGLYSDYVSPLPKVMFAFVLLFLTVCVWFYFSINRGKRKFW